LNNLITLHRKTLLAIFVIAAFASSLFLLTGRIMMEKNNKTVEIVLEYNDIEQITRQEFIPVNTFLGKLKDAGVTSISFTETNLTELQERGKLQWTTQADLTASALINYPGISQNNSLRPDAVYVFDNSPETGSMLRDNVKLLMGNDAVRYVDISTAGNRSVRALEITGRPAVLTLTGIGFDLELIRQINQKGFNIVVRPENRNGINNEKISEYLEEIAKIPGISTVIYGGNNEVIGFPRVLDATVEGMRKFNLSFGDIEVPTPAVKQRGAQYVSLKIPNQTVRVMSLSPLYLQKMNPTDAIDKFRLGVRERNIRVLYLRPFLSGINEMSVADTNIEYIGRLKGEIEKFGFTTGRSSRFPQSVPPALPVILITLGAAATLLLLIDLFHNYDNIFLVSVMLLALVFSAGLIFTGKLHLVQKFAGLGLGLIFPVYAFASRFDDFNSGNKNAGFWQALGHAFKNFSIISLITIAGGLIIAGLFASTTYMLSVDQFRGVKSIIALPSVLTVLLYYMKTRKDGSTLRNMISQPLYIWQAALLVILGAIASVYLMRSGNTAQANVEQEMQFRVMLENLFWVRPRFKVFLIGHPAMILAWAVSFMNFFSGLGLFVLAGAIGQADIINTFTHVHTPVIISLARVLIGAGLGVVLGSIYFAVFRVAKIKVIDKYCIKSETVSVA
jgi:hypothetical protein